MTSPAKQLEVQIMGQSYLLGCPDGGQARLLDAVERVDSAMCKVRDSGKIKARDRIAVLAALNLAFEMSEREAAAAAKPAEPKAAPVTSGTGHTSTATVHAPELDALVRRLDQALAGDGQLL